MSQLCPLYFEMDDGGPVCQNMLEFEPGEMFNFRYAKAIELHIKDKIE